jgi:S-adenosylmethionine:diacylglycerol 3-amino-3-carboxypropyl transferase
VSNPQSLNELLAAIASDHISPGSGTAAAAAMAFAAACAGKALAISRKHHAPDEVALAAQTQLQEIVRKSLERAQVDSARFEDFVHHKDEQSARALIDADQQTQALAAELRVLLDRIEPGVHPVVSGDILAARELLQAAVRIQDRICEENRRAAALLPK